MQSDCAFQIGTSHTVCQDYALSGVVDLQELDGQLAYAIVCDGCSSSENTDVGARFLAWSARNVLIQNANLFPERFVSPQHLSAAMELLIVASAYESLSRVVGCSCDGCLDSTLLVAAVLKSEEFNEGVLIGWGDGVTSTEGSDGSRVVFSHEFECSAPRYLSYLLNASRLEAYRKEFGGKGCFTDLMSGQKFDGDILAPIESSATFASSFSPSHVRFASVMSDGANTFSQIQDDGSRACVGVGDVVNRMMSFKNPVGSFVQRRMRKFQSDAKKEGLFHSDDVSCASIYTGGQS